MLATPQYGHRLLTYHFAIFIVGLLRLIHAAEITPAHISFSHASLYRDARIATRILTFLDYHAINYIHAVRSFLVHIFSPAAVRSIYLHAAIFTMRTASYFARPCRNKRLAIFN